MTSSSSKGAVAALCAMLLIGTQSRLTDYSIWAYSKTASVADTTYRFDDQWNEKSSSTDEWVLSRHSSARIRLRNVAGRWYRVDHALRSAECNSGPFRFALSPFGGYHACVDEYYPETVLRIFSSRDNRRIAEVRLPRAYVEGRNSIAFVDEGHIAFTSIDDTCPRERRPSQGMSIIEISVSQPQVQRTLFHCASAIVVGTHRSGYLRDVNSRYTLDGKTWASGKLYAFDPADNPIVEDSPLVQKFNELHPDMTVTSVSVGVSGAP